jgi:hypothetical protein
MNPNSAPYTNGVAVGRYMKKLIVLALPCVWSRGKELLEIRAVRANLSNAWPFAVVGFALTLTLVWIGTLGYGLFKLVELAL